MLTVKIRDITLNILDDNEPLTCCHSGEFAAFKDNGVWVLARIVKEGIQTIDEPFQSIEQITLYLRNRHSLGL